MVTLLINYFNRSKGTELNTEMAEYATAQLAMARIEKLKAAGINITRHHFAIYRSEDFLEIMMKDPEEVGE